MSIRCFMELAGLLLAMDDCRGGEEGDAEAAEDSYARDVWAGEARKEGGRCAADGGDDNRRGPEQGWISGRCRGSAMPSDDEVRPSYVDGDSGGDDRSGEVGSELEYLPPGKSLERLAKQDRKEYDSAVHGPMGECVPHVVAHRAQ